MNRRQSETIALLDTFFSDEEKELLHIFSLNIATIKCFNKIKDISNKPSSAQISSQLQTIEDLRLRGIIYNRLTYWFERTNDLEWTVEMGIERSRANKKFKETTDINPICEWPGCENDTDLQADHRFPYSLGGGTDSKNSQTLCRGCNLSKGMSVYTINKWPGE